MDKKIYKLDASVSELEKCLRTLASFDPVKLSRIKRIERNNNCIFAKLAEDELSFLVLTHPTLTFEEAY